VGLPLCDKEAEFGVVGIVRAKYQQTLVGLQTSF
jgi:hypothetical protein